MAGKQAKILTDQQIETLLVHALTTRNPIRNQLIVLLSVKAGLRANEIASLTWDIVVGPTGEVGWVLELHDRVAKNKSGGRIPLHPDLRAALALWQRQTRTTNGPVIMSERGLRMTAVSIMNWFAKAFRAAGLEGCSSHSGRRTFITRAARVADRAGASLRDVQLLAGHRSIQATQRYIDGDTEAQRKLVSLI
jgi:integrase/recombinase XerD